MLNPVEFVADRRTRPLDRGEKERMVWGRVRLMLSTVEFVADRDLRSLTMEGPMTMLISYYWGSSCSIVFVIYAIQFGYSWEVDNIITLKKTSARYSNK